MSSVEFNTSNYIHIFPVLLKKRHFEERLKEIKLFHVAKLRNMINDNRDIGAASLLGRQANGETGRRSSTRWASGKNQE